MVVVRGLRTEGRGGGGGRGRRRGAGEREGGLHPHIKASRKDKQVTQPTLSAELLAPKISSWMTPWSAICYVGVLFTASVCPSVLLNTLISMTMNDEQLAHNADGSLRDEDGSLPHECVPTGEHECPILHFCSLLPSLPLPQPLPPSVILQPPASLPFSPPPPLPPSVHHPSLFTLSPSSQLLQMTCKTLPQR